MTEVEIVEQLDAWNAQGRRVFATSSFQSHSIPLLHLMSTLSFRLPVYFIDTGFHFPQTLSFRDQVKELFDLNLIVVKSSIDKFHQRNREWHFLFTSSPERCCHLNKVEPLKPAIERNDIWVSGLRRDQTAHRQSLEPIEHRSDCTVNGLMKSHSCSLQQVFNALPMSSCSNRMPTVIK